MTMQLTFRRRPTPRRLCLECLEDRLAPALLEVVPFTGANGVNAFSSLAQALNYAGTGDTIQIEPGSSPGSGTVNFSSNLTIQGDPAFGGAAGLQASSTQVPSLTLNAANVTLQNLYLGGVTIAAGVTGETVRGSVLAGAVTQTYSTGIVLIILNGHDTIAGNTFLPGSSVTLGNTLGSVLNAASNDTVAGNLFLGATGRVITVSNETSGLAITGNRIEDTLTLPTAAVAIADSTGLVAGNTIHVNGLSAPDGAALSAGSNTGTTNLTISSNDITIVGGVGISLDPGSFAASFTVAVNDNSLAGSGTGVALISTSINGGNFTGVTLSSNDFRGYTGSIFNDAIEVLNSAGGTINAQGNLFSVANPQTVVFATAGTPIDTSNAVTGGAANLDALFLSLGGGLPTAAQHSSLDGAGSLAQAQAAVHSPQALTPLVDGLYVSLLGRAPGAGEAQGWVNALAQGLTEEQLIAGFLASPEYYNRVAQGSINPNGAFVQSLYLNLLGRQGSATEVAGWVSFLNSAGPAGLSAVAQGFVNSAEFRAIQVQAMYGATVAGVVGTPDVLKRHGLTSAAEISGWANSSLGLLAIEALLLSSGEFTSAG
jgi:hypothetical protein